MAPLWQPSGTHQHPCGTPMAPRGTPEAPLKHPCGTPEAPLWHPYGTPVAELGNHWHRYVTRMWHLYEYDTPMAPYRNPMASLWHPSDTLTVPLWHPYGTFNLNCWLMTWRALSCWHCFEGGTGTFSEEVDPTLGLGFNPQPWEQEGADGEEGTDTAPIVPAGAYTVHFSAQPEPFVTQDTPLMTP